MKISVFSAAGGNPTATVYDSDHHPDNYARINYRLQKDSLQIEQVAFYEEQDDLPKLQMAGGEFCGNATRAFACLLKELSPNKSEFNFYVSGFPGIVSAKVKIKELGLYFCEVRFENFNYSIRNKELDSKNISIVDLGGIIHIIVDESILPFDEKNYEKKMKEMKNELGIDCDAVGVLWLSKKNNKIAIKPVVWVKNIDTCYYETSCGSGSIAVGLAENKNVEVLQPSGGTIYVRIEGDTLIMASEMKKILEIN